jgi:hypothetical protein
MKTMVLICSLAGVGAGTLPAQPPPPPPPIREHIRIEGQPAVVGQQPPSGPQTWLGVQVREVAPELYQHVELTEGTGLVVDFVAPNGPAAQAGVEKFDILVKLEDQLLVNPAQLQTLVRTKKEGDRVELALLRKGQPVRLTATLGKVDRPPVKLGGPGAFEWDEFVPLPAPRPPGGGGGSATVSQAAATATDGEYTFSATIRDGDKRLVVRDRAGTTVFDGPYNTEDERAKLPAELRERVEKLKLFDRPAPRIRMQKTNPT